MSFADRLRELRQAKGLSREQLSALSGLGKGTVRDYEQGLREPTLRTAFRLADALGVSVEAFREGAAGENAPGPSQETRTPGKAARKLSAKKNPPKSKGSAKE